MQVPIGADEAEKRAVYVQMEEIHKKISDGERFEALSMAFSQAPQASKGGDLGFFKMDVLAPKLQKAIEGLMAGEVTDILDTDQGYQIFLVQKIASEGAKSMEAASPEIERTLFNEVVDKKFKAWLENLRNRSHIKIIR
jgi:peptidyl-prolyl cis-trans isomerase SurA